MSLQTLLLLRKLLLAQQLVVGDPAFIPTVETVIVALRELNEAIGDAQLAEVAGVELVNGG